MIGRRFGLEFEHVSKLTHSKMAELLEAVGLAIDRYATGQTYCPEGCYSGWQVKTDLSITSMGSYPNRIELVSPPLLLSNSAQVKLALDTVRKQAALNSSCGLHVHVGVPELLNIMDKSMSLWRKRIEKSWAEVERVFFSYVTPNRRLGQYCAPGIDWGRKYSALNVCPMTSDRRTVEFRLHSPTLNAEKAMAFAALCVMFVEHMITAPKSAYIGEIEPDSFKPPEVKRVWAKKGHFYLHRDSNLWIVEKGDKSAAFPTLEIAYESMRETLGLMEATPLRAFRFPEVGNAMTELCKHLGLNGLRRSYLENRYSEMLRRYGPVKTIDNRVQHMEDDGDFFHEEEIPQDFSVPLVNTPEHGTVSGSFDVSSDSSHSINYSDMTDPLHLRVETNRR